MASRLADETLHQILKIALEVPDDDFVDVSGLESSPFARRRGPSSSDVLLVCKRWMRVATPLLYDTVILRSTAQAQALARALKKAPEFAPYLKKLRLEGGFGAAVGKTMRAASVLRDFHLSLDLGPKDNTKCMCDALLVINPIRLVLTGINWAEGFAPVRPVLLALQRSVPTWSNVTTLVIAHRALGHPEFASLVTTFTDLLVVHVKNYQGFDSPTLVPIFKSFRKTAVHIHYEAERTSHWPRQRLEKCYAKYLPRLFIHLTKCLDNTPVPPTVCALPLHRAPIEVQRTIWGVIMEYALETEISKRHDTQMNQFYTPATQSMGRITTNANALQYMTVCRLFLDICTRAAARHLSLGGSPQSFLATLERKPEVATAVQSLHWSTCFGNSLLIALLAQLPRLMTLSCSTYLSDVHKLHCHFACLERLVELHLVLYPQALPSPVVISFPTLRFLSIVFAGTDLPTPELPLDLAVPSLAELVLPSPNPSWCSKVFPQTPLPQLRALSVSYWDERATEDLLSAYGRHCERVMAHTSHVGPVLAHCPDVRKLTLTGLGLPDALQPLDSTRVYPHLARLVFPTLSNQADQLGYTKKEAKLRADAIEAFFAALSTETFPMLRAIDAEGILWPATPRDIATNPAVRWAECLRSKGIALSGEGGKTWRPRLQPLQPTRAKRV